MTSLSAGHGNKPLQLLSAHRDSKMQNDVLLEGAMVCIEKGLTVDSISTRNKNASLMQVSK
jgi:hypothetical protein